MLANTSDMPQTRQWITQKRVWCVQKFLEKKSFAKTQNNFLHVLGRIYPNQVHNIQDGEEISICGTVEKLNKKCEDR